MKAMILCLSPKECVKLLNGDLSILVRKRFPKDYVGWVYIYCTKDKKIFLRDFRDKKKWATYWKFVAMGNDSSNVGELPPILNGKVVTRFWCDKVEEIEWELPNKLIFPKNMLENACLSGEELYKYLGEKGGYAIHITKLETFDKPKEISDFRVFPKVKRIETDKDFYLFTYGKPLTHTLKTYCYVEI